MTCAGDSALPAIFEFHSTVVMNFISSHGLYCAYPHLTMAEQGIPSSSYFAETRSQTSRRLLRKYRERGYVIEEKLDDHLSAVGHTCFVHPSCPLTIRTLYDGHGAFMTFAAPAEGTDIRAPIIYDNKHSAVWTLGGMACNHMALYHKRFVCSIPIRSNNEASFDQNKSLVYN